MSQVTEEICQKKDAITSFAAPLKSTKEIYSIFLIPTIMSCFIYVTHFLADVLVAAQHFEENNFIWACVTIIFVYAPAITYFIITVSRPDWWMTEDDKLKRGYFLWFILQMGKLIAFPLFALYRYAALLVLSIKAIKSTGETRKKVINIVDAPAAIELYFFLQAWFQAAPQAVFQTHLLLKEKQSSRSIQSEIIQGLCIIMSIFIMAIRTTSFQRYESQRVIGRKVPWAMWLKKYRCQELENFEEKQLLQSNIQSSASTEKTETASCENEKNSDLKIESHVNLQRQNSSTPPLPPKNVKIVPPPTPIRGITSIMPLTVPDSLAPAEPPKEDSLISNYEENQIDERGKTLMNKMDSAQDFKKLDTKVNDHKNFAKGLENDDSSGTFLSIVWWFFFILPRILSIAIFFEFYPKSLLLVLVLHYICMIFYLFYYAKYNDLTTFFINLWLGFVYMFSIIEYRIKFKYADKWLVFYYTSVILQNIFMTMTWYLYGNWEGLWYSHSFKIIFICMSLCLISTIVYYFLLKPKKRKVYIT